MIRRSRRVSMQGGKEIITLKIRRGIFYLDAFRSNYEFLAILEGFD